MVKKKPVKPDWSKKSSHKGKACRRGDGVYYDELKKPISLTLTPTAIEILKKLALEQKISRSEVVERWLRSQQNSPET